MSAQIVVAVLERGVWPWPVAIHGWKSDLDDDGAWRRARLSLFHKLEAIEGAGRWPWKLQVLHRDDAGGVMWETIAASQNQQWSLERRVFEALDGLHAAVFRDHGAGL